TAPPVAASSCRTARTMIAMQPMIEAAKMAMPSQTTGWRHADIGLRDGAALWRPVASPGWGHAVGIAVDPGGDQPGAVLAQPIAPGRHDAGAAVADAPLDVRDRAAVKPGAVAQVGRAHRRVALPGRTVAGGACLEQRLAQCCLHRVARL